MPCLKLSLLFPFLHRHKHTDTPSSLLGNCYKSSESEMKKTLQQWTSFLKSKTIRLSFRVNLDFHQICYPYFFFSSISNQTTPIPRYPCSHPLILNKKSKMCEPPCTWVMFTSAEDFALKVVDNLSISVSLLSFIIILATWIRIKQLWVKWTVLISEYKKFFSL